MREEGAKARLAGSVGEVGGLRLREFVAWEIFIGWCTRDSRAVLCTGVVTSHNLKDV